MAKVKNQSIPATEPTYYPPGDVVYFGEQFRAALTPGTNVKGQDPLWAVATKTKKGARPTTRTKKKNGLWYDPSFLPAPFLPEDVADVVLNNKFGHKTTRRVLFKKSIALWNKLSKASRICWYNKAKDSGVKCSYFDFFMRSQLFAWRSTGKFDTDTCATCPSPTINYTTQQMTINQSQSLSTPDTGLGPFQWSITQGGGSLSQSSGLSTIYKAPASNPNCASNPTIRVTNNCGSFAEIRLAINCGTGVAGYLSCCATGRELGTCRWFRGRNNLYCNGSLAGWCNVICGEEEQKPCTIPEFYAWQVSGCLAAIAHCNENCPGGCAAGHYSTRTTAQLAAGCCPAQLL